MFQEHSTEIDTWNLTDSVNEQTVRFVIVKTNGEITLHNRPLIVNACLFIFIIQPPCFEQKVSSHGLHKTGGKFKQVKKSLPFFVTIIFHYSIFLFFTFYFLYL